MNDNYPIDWPAPDCVQSAARANKSKVTKPPKVVKKADNIHVYKDQDYINTLSGVTKIAVVAISELVNQGKADFLFLRDEEVKDFWEKHLVKIVSIREEKERVKREQEMRKAALAKLSAEEKKLLGIR
jgi:hypothetical protein